MEKGLIHSIQTLGTLDGPGVRFVLFLQGCPLRCACCHNPDTWNPTDGTEYGTEELLARVERYRSYFGDRGGVTLSGGEPLLQTDFSHAFFKGCREREIHTCLDTAGCILHDGVKKLLDVTDRVLLDIKYSTDEDYQAHVGCSLDSVLEFLELLDEKGIPTTLRTVIIPTLNDTKEHVLFLKELQQKYACVDGIELLPFKKICEVKYREMGVPFPLFALPVPTKETMDTLNDLLKGDNNA